MKTIRDILAEKTVAQIQFYIVDSLQGSKIAWTYESADGITEIFISPAMFKLLNDDEATIDQIIFLSDQMKVEETDFITRMKWTAEATKPIRLMKEESICRSHVSAS